MLGVPKGMGRRGQPMWAEKGESAASCRGARSGGRLNGGDLWPAAPPLTDHGRWGAGGAPGEAGAQALRY